MDHDPVASIQTLPAIALRGLTVFPNVLIHFDVGRAASIKAMEAAMAAGEPVFLVGQKDMTVERPERDDLYTVGTLSNVRQILRMPGDNVRVMVEGISRARLRDVTQREPYLMAEIEAIPEEKAGIIGIILSFVEVILRETDPPRCFLGIIPGRDGFYDRAKNRFAYPIDHVVMYQFSESLFFANVKIFVDDIEQSITDDTKVVIVDAGAVTNIDITAADRLEQLADSLQGRGIAFYMTEHHEGINAKLRKLGKGQMIQKGYVRRTITAALHDAGIREPYPVTSMPEQKRQFIMNIPAEAENTLEEFAWAFGEDTVNEIERRVHIVLEHIHQMPDLEQLAEQGIEELMETWHTLGAIDEDEFLRRMELHMDELPEHMTEEHNRRVVLELIEKRRRHIARQLQQDNPEILEKLKASRVKLEKRLEKQQPEAAKRLRRLEEKLHHK